MSNSLQSLQTKSFFWVDSLSSGFLFAVYTVIWSCALLFLLHRIAQADKIASEKDATIRQAHQGNQSKGTQISMLMSERDAAVLQKDQIQRDRNARICKLVSARDAARLETNEIRQSKDAEIEALSEQLRDLHRDLLGEVLAIMSRHNDWTGMALQDRNKSIALPVDSETLCANKSFLEVTVQSYKGRLDMQQVSDEECKYLLKQMDEEVQRCADLAERAKTILPERKGVANTVRTNPSGIPNKARSQISSVGRLIQRCLNPLRMEDVSS